MKNEVTTDRRARYFIKHVGAKMDELIHPRGDGIAELADPSKFDDKIDRKCRNAIYEKLPAVGEILATYGIQLIEKDRCYKLKIRSVSLTQTQIEEIKTKIISVTTQQFFPAVSSQTTPSTTAPKPKVAKSLLVEKIKGDLPDKWRKRLMSAMKDMRESLKEGRSSFMTPMIRFYSASRQPPAQENLNGILATIELILAPHGIQRSDNIHFGGGMNKSEFCFEAEHVTEREMAFKKVRTIYALLKKETKGVDVKLPS